MFEGNARFLRYPPKVVLVKFYEMKKEGKRLVKKPCAWQLKGMPEPGLYPIHPKTRGWYLDQRREKPQLLVRRLQLPLAPAYATTAHASQGQTLRAAILDLQLGRGVSAIASYVAMTRLRKLEDLLILSDFDRQAFAAGPLERPTVKILIGRP